ncbi:MAG: LytTR family transcriptional regulator DNA-binding domain-containing protein [Prevotellaceae bacterium]|nr:LytTR family transcriptional regulator DNA-binding domain-containing protein [Prevotellaceae bacterium]
MVNKKIPAYIYGKKNSIHLVLFTALFALVFINMFEPFSSRLWHGGVLSSELYLIFSSLIVLTGVLVVVISRILLYYRGRRHGVSFGTYGVWIVLEIFFMSLFYTVYTLYFPATAEPASLIDVVKKVLMRTSLVLLLPYAVLHLYFAYKDKEKQLQLLQEDLASTTPQQNVYSFYDERGDLRLSVTRENLLYIEAADNYVIVRYLNKGSLTKLLLRNSLKAIEKNMAHTNVVRCHRSYMVNLDAVTVIRRQKGDIFMEFGKEQVPDIPVSSKYDEKITRWFTS